MINTLRKSRISVQRQLFLIIMAVSTISLFLAASLFTLHQLREYRLSMLEGLTSAVYIAAENAQAAIWFENEADAKNIVMDFSNDPRIQSAAIYTKEKQLFAAYDISEEGLSDNYEFSAQGAHHQFDGDYLHLHQPIRLQGKTAIVGYFYLKVTLEAIYRQLKQNVLVIIVIVISVFMLTLLLTSRLQKIISGPILKLLQATRMIKDNKDYSIRVESNGYIEINELCDGFNIMLEEIENRDKHLQNLALYDELTGIPNRSLFIDHFEIAISHSRRTSTELAICFLDIDNFKPINDNFGHEVGDKLLIEVASRITESIRLEDTVSRQGGDEFALLLGGLEHTGQFEELLERIFHSLTQPYEINGYQHNVTVSCGVTLYPSDDADIDTLIRHADQAMYNAKLAGKHCYHLFNSINNKEIIRKYHRLSEIEHALETNQFSLFYQPKVNMATGKVYGAEALIRWLHPEKGLTPPLDFLPAIEGTKLEDRIGDWVINQGLIQLEEWSHQGLNLEVSVNISSHHLQSENFIQNLKEALEKHQTVDPGLLQLEVLESSALGDLMTIRNIIESCQELGVNVALDDFGTGYSSLTHIRSLPVQVIKIDQSFVRDILDDPSDYAIVNGVIGLADSFSRNVIAEGVETTEHGLLLLLSGCNHAQGYGIAKPMPSNELVQWCLNYEPNERWLACAAENRTKQENKLKLFRLFSDQWVEKIKTIVQAPLESEQDWPIMDREKGHYTYWMKRAKQEHMFNDMKLQNFNIEHEKVHKIANSLLNQYQSNDIDRARKGLDILYTAVSEENLLLEELLDVA